MPSPLGHALAGAAAGWAVAGPAAVRDAHGRPRRLWITGAAFALLGMLPDLDLLTASHRGASHSISAALLVGVAGALLTRRWRLGLAAAAAFGSHALLDWLGSDTSAPFGIMALWPFVREHYHSRIDLFDAISRRYWLPGFWEQNARAIGRELLILLPPLGLVIHRLWLVRADRRRGEGED